MIQHLKQREPEKYRLIAILAVTSIIGVLLIFLAVYNASRELEIIHEVDNLHRLARAKLASHSPADELVHEFSNRSSGDYQLMVLENSSIISIHDSNLREKFPLDMVELEQTRVNENGGYIEVEDRIYTWAMLPVTGSNRHLVLINRFTGNSAGILIKVYSERLLIPAVFYVWLMVWVALIIRGLADRLRGQNKELEHMALHDNLTGLPNRILLEDRLHRMIEDCRRNQGSFALAVIDLDRFKEVNDTLGHDQGDELLRLVAERIRNILRAVDTFARIGGDEFVLLLNGVNKESCVTMCERIKTSILKPYCLKDAEVNIGSSIGIAMCPEHGEESTTLMRNADMAMYTIKSKGGGIHFYEGHQKILNKIGSGTTASSA